jgi:hypothetical protein
MLAYLCGPIEFPAESGRMWRRKLSPFLTEELGHRVYDPAEDEKKNLNEEEAAHFREWKTTDLDRFRAVVRKIIQFDLQIIENKADYFICFWDAQVARSGGTEAELTAAYRKGLPVYLVAPAPSEQVSEWMLACADRIFASVDELKDFLRMRYGKKKPGSPWAE